MRAVARARGVVERDDQPGVAPTDAARRLDVLGGRLRLAHHDHQPSRSMSTPTEIMFVARITSRASSSGWQTLHAASRCAGMSRRWLAAGQLDPLRRVDRPGSAVTAMQLKPVADVVLHLHAGAAEDAQAVEVADERPVRVLA